MGVLLWGFKDKHLQKASSDGFDIFRAGGFFARLDLAVERLPKSCSADRSGNPVLEQAFVRAVQHKHWGQGRGARMLLGYRVLTSSQRFDL